MSLEIKAWLTEIGLDQYVDTFVDNAVDAELLPHLTNDDLKDLGIARLGDRKKLLLAIEHLKQGATTQPTQTLSTETVTGGDELAERRQVTIVFADLVDSTALSTRLDAEDYRDLIRTYQDTCAGIVAQYDGFIAKYMGDGVLVYFGWPRAHEDDAERAINTAIELIDAMQRIDDDAAGKLMVRVGIATGRVVVGDIIGESAAQEAAIAGEAPNLAARLQALAAPNQIIISNATYRIAGSLFECTHLGSHRLKGFAEPVSACRVDRALSIGSRFEATRKKDLTPFVGRDEEIEVLRRRWEGARAGDGQVVLISGEPGIGKSRIVNVLEEQLDGQNYHRLRYQCSPYHTSSAFYPVIGQIERAARIQPADTPDDKLKKLAAVLAMSGRSSAAYLPRMAQLLSIPTDEPDAQTNITPARQKQMMLEALVDLLVGLTENDPVLFHFEDAHWIDPTTRAFLDLVIARATDIAVLVIVSFRPGFTPPWTGENHVTFLSLSRLDPHACIKIATEVGRSAALPSSVVDEIVARTDGLPLFVEEVTKSVMEMSAADQGDTTRGNAITIPASIEDSLMARLDRLGPVKETAQVASVIGRSFRQDVIASVMELDEAAIEVALDRLVDAGIVNRRTVSGGVGFEFRHVLAQEAAYQSILRPRRQNYHARIAETLETQFPGVAEPELIAHHHTEAAHDEKAIEWWMKAARREMKRSAHREGEAHLRRGLDLLNRISDPAFKDRCEIALRNLLGVCMMPTRGFGNPEVAAEFSRAAQLCELREDHRSLFIALRGKGQYNMISGNMQIACDDTTRILELAERLDDRNFRIEAHHLGWSALCFRGDFHAAQHHAEIGIDNYERERDHHLTYVYSGHDPGVCCRAFGSLSHAQLGLPDRALQLCNAGVELADDLQHPFSFAIALWAKGILHQLRCEPVEVYAAGERLLQHCKESGLPPMAPLGKVFCGDALASRGEHRDGIRLLREGIDEFHSFGTAFTVPSFFPALALAYAGDGRICEGLAALDEGLVLAERGFDHFSLPEIHRIRGQLFLAQSVENRQDAEASYRLAIDVAQCQKARLLELRATGDLARLMCENGDRQAAFDVLASVYDGFSEGFETIDLKDAKKLLQTLK